VKTMSLKFLSWVLSLTALMVVGNTISVRAEAVSTNTEKSQAEATDTWVTAIETGASDVSNLESASDNSNIADTAAANVESNVPLALAPANTAKGDNTPADSQVLQQLISNEPQAASNVDNATKVATPVPGTLQTSATYLQGKPQTASVPAASSSSPANKTVAQVTPGRPTRGGLSYIGVGGNIGLTGSNTLGNGSFAINSKIGLTRNISVRPAVLIGDDATFLIPATYDFTIQTTDPFEPVAFAPFVGGGLVVSTQSDNNIGFLLTGGVDVPLSREFVANATVNVGFMDKTEVGLLLGVGYTFVGF
jgi:hypothetical protein